VEPAKTERLWFAHTVEAMFVRAFGVRLTPALRARVASRGIDLDRLKPAYPVDEVVAALKNIVPDVFGRVPEAEAMHQLGVSFMQGYVETLVGKAMVQMMKLIGARRTLERMQKNFRTGGNYVETRFKALGPTQVELWINDVSDIPDWYRGVIEEGGRMVGAKNLRVTQRHDAGQAWFLDVTWDG